LLAADRVFSVASVKKERLDMLEIDPNWMPNSLSFQNVSAEFSDSKFCVHDINFTLNRGEILAVVGHSGAGKTSLINLILKFLDPSLGTIFLDQYDIQAMDPYQVRKYFSVVSQNVKLFSANLRENLLLANSQATDDQLVKVLRQVELEDWFSHLPDGMNTWIGDQGYKLSGGERQRLAIARALLQDRPFLLLDEPVEHLDTKMAERLIDTVFQLFDTRGILWVTHDHASTHQANKVIKLKSGQIALS
jgi:ABC-type transport system involved in cytochrome bd biosynthesis fused ATPase/permease subunit